MKNKINKYSQINIIIIAVVFLTGGALFGQNLSQNLEVFLPFECSPADESGNGRSGIIHGDPQCVSGRLGMAYSFDGTDDFIELPAEFTTSYISDNGFSWSMWFNPASIPAETISGVGSTLLSVADNRPTDDILLGFGSLTAPKNQFIFQTDGAGGFGASMIPPLSYNPPSGWQTGEWYHVCGVRDYNSDEVILYINGSEETRTTFNGDPITRQMFAAVGAFFDGKAEAFFHGIIDEVRIYSRVLTPEEIQFIYDIKPGILTASPNPAVFGKIFCSNDTSQVITLKNNGSSVINITETLLTAGTNFLINGGGAFDIQPGSPVEIQISLTAQNTGIYYDTLIIKNSNTIPELHVPISAEKGKLSYTIGGIDNNKIHFGTLCPDESKDTNISISTQASVKTKFIGEISPPFAFLDSALAYSSAEFDTVETRNVPLRFTGSSAEGSVSSTLTITDPCGELIFIELSADVHKPLFSVEAPPIENICPDDTVDTFIKITNSDSRNLDFELSSSNPLFIHPSNISIGAGETKEAAITFTGRRQGGTVSTDLTLKTQCGTDTTIQIELIINDIRISLSPDTLDFGELILCSPDTSLTLTMSIVNENISDRPVIASDFDLPKGYLTSMDLGEKFIIGEVQTYEVTFVPGESGIYEGLFEITFDTCDVKRSFYLRGTAKHVDMSVYEELDAGRVIIGMNKDTVIVFKNTGTADLNIEEFITAAGPQFEVLSLSKPVPGVVPAGDSLVINVRFNAEEGIFTDTVKISGYSPCGDFDYTIPLRGEGVWKAYVKIVIPGNLEASPGEVLSLPVQLAEQVDLERSKIQGFTAVLDVNPTLLIPINPTPQGVLENRRLKINIEIPPETMEDNLTLAVFPFKTALGNSETDTIRITDIYPIAGYADIDSSFGIFRLKNVCHEGGPRLFESVESLELSLIKPNPAENTAEIEFEIIEEGRTKIYITDINGNEKASILSRYMTPGAYSIIFDISQLNPGTYFYVLETPSQMKSGKMLIQR